MFSEYMLIALFYICGVLISSKISMAAVFFAAVFAVLLFTARLILAKKKNTAILAAALVFLFGGIRYYQASENRLYYELPDKYVTLYGTVVSMPAETDGMYGFRLTVKSDYFTYLDNKYVTHRNILVNTNQKFEYGDIVKMSGFLSEIAEESNSSEYSYSKYYKSVGIYNRITAREAEKIGEKRSYNPIFLVGKAKARMSESADKCFDQNRAALYKVITVGDKTGFSDEYKDLLVRTGMHRALYASFIHISLITFAAALVFRSRMKEKRSFAVMLALILYALANSGSATALKAAAFFAALLYCREVRGFSDKIAVLSLIVTVMTVIDPMLCFSGGFLLSAATSVIVYLSYPAFFGGITKIFPGRRFIKLKSVSAMYLILLVGTLPITAFFFNGISVYGFVLTYALVPITAAVLVLSPFVSAASAIFGSAPIFGAAADFLLGIIEKVPYAIEKLPFCYVTLPKPGLMGIVIFYTAWTVILRCADSRLKTAKTAVGIAVLCGFLAGSVNPYSFDSLSLYFVNVGQGDGAALKTSRGEVVLIDGGGSPVYETGSDIGERVYVPYLISYGLTDIDVAIVSHYHKDHVEGIISAAERLRINTIIAPNSSPDNECRRRLEEIAERRKIKMEYLGENDAVEFKSGLTIKFLAPDAAQLESDDLNDTSLVAEVSFGDFRALFTGDSTDKISDAYPQNIDILKVAHHGSDTASDEEYVNWVKPKYAVISVGEDNSYELPKDTVVKRLGDGGAEILRTDKCGDIRFTVKKNGKMRIVTMMGE